MAPIAGMVVSGGAMAAGAAGTAAGAAGAAAPYAALAAGPAMKAIGAYRQGKMAEAAHKFNAEAARRQAESTRTAGAEEQFEQRRQMRRHLAKNRAANAAAGATMSGTPLYNQLETARAYARDISTTGLNYERYAAALDTEAALQNTYADYARDSRRLNVAAAILGGATDMGAFMGANALRKPPKPPGATQGGGRLIPSRMSSSSPGGSK